MDRDDPGTPTNVHVTRLAEVRRLLEDVDGREHLAMAASVGSNRCFRWASLGPDSGLTEAQEDFVDYWSPERVLAECRTRRELICTLDEWALTAASASDLLLVDRLLVLLRPGAEP